jgi:YD repeat-containing protein
MGRVVRQEWCTCGALDALIDANGNRTRWERDVQTRVTKEIRADDREITYTYEPGSSRLQSMTDAKQQVTTYAYFADDRLQGLTFTNEEVATSDVSYTYDAPYGRVASMVDGTGPARGATFRPCRIKHCRCDPRWIRTVDGQLTDSIDNFDPRAMSGRLGQRAVAGDHRRLNRFGEGHVHGVVRADVVAQLPRTTQQIEVGVTVEIEVSEIGNRFVRTAGRDLTGSHETSEALSDFDVHQVRRVQFVVLAKEAGLNSCAKRSLQKKLQQSRRVDDDHTDSRSSRMTTAPGVFRVTRFRLWSFASISPRVGRAARRSSSASK